MFLINTLRIFTTAALFTLLAHAGDTALDRATLKGVIAVGIVIDQVPAELAKDGVTADTLIFRLTQKLKDAKIPIDNESREFVSLRVTSVRAPKGPYAVSFTIGLYQPVMLSRDAKQRAVPMTWEVESILMAEPKQLSPAAMETVDELAARFITAYRSVNP